MTALRNTCAGIKQLRTFGEVARVRVAKSEAGSDGHLELVFEDGTEEGPAAAPRGAVKTSFGALTNHAVSTGKEYGGP